ncbi:unnamed protein product [Mortierella alpina]
MQIHRKRGQLQALRMQSQRLVLTRVPDPPTMDLELRKVETTLYNLEGCHAALPFEVQVQCPDAGEKNKDSWSTGRDKGIGRGHGRGGRWEFVGIMNVGETRWRVS